MFDRLLPAALVEGALQHLRDAGVRRGGIVGWLGHNSWDMVATLAACERLGAVLLPLNWRLAAGELARVLQHAGASHLLGTPEMARLATEVLTLAPLQPGPAPGVQPGDLLLVHTSGSTGTPKGAMHTATGLQANAVAAIAAQGFTAASRVLTVLPLFQLAGLCIQTLPALAAGARVSLQPRFEPTAWFDAVEQWRPTATLLVPAMMQALVEHARWAGADLSSLVFVNSSSQIVPRALIDAFHARGVPVAQVYGATETGSVSLVLRPDEALAHPGMAGRPAVGVQLRLAADGEVRLKGANLMRGYHRSSETAFDAEGWFHTGDVAVQHAGGMLEVVGRSGDLIISGGKHIHPAEIEQWAATLPFVAECAVVARPDARWGDVPVLALVLQPGFRLDAAAKQQLQAVFDAQLARFKHPHAVQQVAALPKSALGQLQRAALAQQLADGAAAAG